MRRRCLGLWVRGFLLWLAFSASAWAEPSAKKAIGFSNLVFRPEGGERVGLVSDEIRVPILEHLRERGLNAVGAEDLVFGTSHASSADLLLGGTVKELECRSNSDSSRLTCRMGIEWKVLDVRADKVVYQLLSRGHVDSPNAPAGVVGKRLVLANLDSLLEHARFRRLLEPDPAQAPSPGYPKATLRACRAPHRAMPAAAEQVLGATVVVQTASGFGSGFVVSADGFVVTAAHVVDEPSATIKLRDGRQYPASVIRVDRRGDIALLRLALPETARLSCLPVRGVPLGVGADVYVAGAPESRQLEFSLARGIVSGVRLLDGVQYLQTDAAVNHGNSGGPLISADGEAVAIVTFKLVGSSVEGIAFGAPVAVGLNALGVTLADSFSSPDLAGAPAVAPARARAAFVDKPDPVPLLPEPPARDTRVQGLKSRHVAPELRRGLMLGGATMLTGGLLLLATGYVAKNNASGDAGGTLRTWGWVGSAVGGGMFGLAIVLP